MTGPPEDGSRELVVALLGDALRVVTSHPPHGEFAEYSTADAVVLRVYSRCRSLFAASALLVKEGFAEEALILGRSLFEDALRLMELAASDDRNALVLGFITRSLGRKRELIESAVRLGLESDATAILEALEGEAQKVQRMQDRLGVLRVRHFDSEKVLAARHDRRAAYWTFEFGHQMTHGSMVSHETRTEGMADGAMGIFLKTTDIRYLESSAAFLVAAMVDSQRAASAIFGWPEPAELAGLSERAEAMGNVGAD